MTTVTIKREAVPALLATIPKSAIFTAKFIKTDMTIRSMNCRRGVKSALAHRPVEQGGDGKPAGSYRAKPVMDKKYVTVYDMHKKAYRHLNQDTILSIHAARVEYVVED